MIRGIIFDLDGTLVDSMALWSAVDRKFLNSFGKEPKDSLEEAIKTMSFTESLVFIKEDYDIPISVEEMANVFHHLVGDAYRYEVPPKAGVRDFIDYCRKRGIRMAVATANSEELTAAALERLEVMPCIDFILTCNDVGVNKNSPEIYREACRRMGLKSENVVVFEDALHCVVTAKSAGFSVVAVADESAKAEEELLRLQADYYITDYKEAYGILEQL